MMNLAGDKKCDRTIATELVRATIEVVEGGTGRGEVPARLHGRLGPILFWRAWSYWMADGPVPLKLAQDIFAAPRGRDAVLVEGACSSPTPDSPWVSWYTRSGIRVFPADQEAEFMRFSAWWPALAARTAPLAFHDAPPSLGASPFIDRYDIGTEEGLHLFAERLRAHELDRIPRPAWWQFHHQ